LLQAGETVLITAAAGGVGNAAVQIARHGRVVTTPSPPPPPCAMPASFAQALRRSSAFA